MTRRGFRRRHLGLIAILAVICLVLGALLEFGSKLKKADQSAGALAQADAIVALTGGTDRLDEAMRLLNEHRGARLLISGVNAETSRDDLRRRFPDANETFDCCVDLDHAAMDTIGNAAETARWARGQGFHTLIVVTGAYHMPRSLLLLHEAGPELTLIGHPVSPEKLHLEMWWTQPSTIRLVVSEFAKYVFSLLRIRLAEGLAWS